MRNRRARASAGLDRGAYHFFTLCQPGSTQAANFLRAVPADPKALPAAVDLELGGNCAARPDRSWLDRELGDFLNQVEATTGHPAVIYLGDDFEDRYQVRDELNRPIWYRRILLRPGTETWSIWQFNHRAKVDGIDTDADLDVGRLNRWVNRIRRHRRGIQVGFIQ